MIAKKIHFFPSNQLYIYLYIYENFVGRRRIGTYVHVEYVCSVSMCEG